MRITVFCILAAALCCGVDCTNLPWGQSGPPDTQVADNPATQPATDDQNTTTSDSETDGTGSGCYSGTFMCSDGPDWSPCGTWYFSIEADDTIIGGGRLTLPAPFPAIAVTLSGNVDPTADSQEITVTIPDVGSGTMHVGNVGPTLDLTGDWSFTHGPQTDGDEFVGEITGTSCQPLP